MTEIRITPLEKRILPWLAAVGFFMQALDNTILNTALPAIASDFHVSPLQMQSAVISYMLTVAMLIPASGWLADRFGTRHVFFSSIILFTIGSLLCAMSTSLPQLVSARVLQGIGGALLVPVGRLAILKAFPREEFLRAISLVVIPGLIGPLLGPTIGGWLVEHASWEWVFLINLPIGFIGAIITILYMPNMKEETRKFDWMGYLFFSVGVVLISVALQVLSEDLHNIGLAISFLIPGLIGIFAYYWHHKHHDRVLFHKNLFKVTSFRIGILGNLVARLGSGALPYLNPLFLQVALGFSPVQAGLTMVPIALGAMTTKPLANRIVMKYGYRRILGFNTLLLGALIASFVTITHDTPYWLLLIHLASLGVFNSLQFTAMNSLTLTGLERDAASSGNSLLSVVMQLSMSLGVAFSATLFALFFGFQNNLHELGAQVSQHPDVLSAFHATYLTIGILSMMATLIFRQLPPPESSVR